MTETIQMHPFFERSGHHAEIGSSSSTCLSKSEVHLNSYNQFFSLSCSFLESYN